MNNDENNYNHKLHLYVEDGKALRYQVDNEGFIHHTPGISGDFGTYGENSIIKSMVHINGTNTDVFVYTDESGQYRAKTSDGSLVDLDIIPMNGTDKTYSANTYRNNHDFTMLKNENGQMYGYTLDGKTYINNNSNAYDADKMSKIDLNTNAWKSGGFSNENGITSITCDDGTVIRLYNDGNNNVTALSSNSGVNISESVGGTVKDITNVGAMQPTNTSVNTSVGSNSWSNSGGSTPADHTLQLYIKDGSAVQYHVNGENEIHHTSGAEGDFGTFSEDSLIKSKIHINGTNTDVYIYTDENGNYRAKTNDGSTVDLQLISKDNSGNLNSANTYRGNHEFTMLKDENGKMYGYMLDGKKYINNSTGVYNPDRYAALKPNDGSWATGGMSTQNSVSYLKLDDGTVIRLYNDGKGNMTALSSNSGVEIYESVDGKIEKINNIGANGINGYAYKTGNSNLSSSGVSNMDSINSSIDAITKLAIPVLGIANVAVPAIGRLDLSSITGKDNRSASVMGTVPAGNSNNVNASAVGTVPAGNNNNVNVMGTVPNTNSTMTRTIDGKKIDLSKYSDQQLADLVDQGKFGSGDDRKKLLGNKYRKVQDISNQRYSSPSASSGGTSSTKMATGLSSGGTSSISSTKMATGLSSGGTSSISSTRMATGLSFGINNNVLNSRPSSSGMTSQSVSSSSSGKKVVTGTSR